jgi:hypothetical protein
MTKMQSYIQYFGSGIHFYCGPGEAAHKTFVKSAGQQTQRRVGKFAQQTAHQKLQLYAVNACYTASSLCVKLSHTIWKRRFSKTTG